MPTPSIFPYLLKAQAGGGGGDPIQTFTSEPISLDFVAANQISIQFTYTPIGISVVDAPYSLDLGESTVIAQQGGTLDIAQNVITLEINCE